MSFIGSDQRIADTQNEEEEEKAERMEREGEKGGLGLLVAREESYSLYETLFLTNDL